MSRWGSDYEAYDAGQEAGAYGAADRAEREMDRMQARWDKERTALVDHIRHMANTVHQAHHQDSPGGWLECDRGLCADARKAIGYRAPVKARP